MFLGRLHDPASPGSSTRSGVPPRWPQSPHPGPGANGCAGVTEARQAQAHDNAAEGHQRGHEGRAQVVSGEPHHGTPDRRHHESCDAANISRGDRRGVCGRVGVALQQQPAVGSHSGEPVRQTVTRSHGIVDDHHLADSQTRGARGHDDVTGPDRRCHGTGGDDIGARPHQGGQHGPREQSDQQNQPRLRKNSGKAQKEPRQRLRPRRDRTQVFCASHVKLACVPAAWAPFGAALSTV